MNCETIPFFAPRILVLLWAFSGISCAADVEVLQKVQAVAVRQMGVFTTMDRESFIALVVEVTNSSPQRIVVEQADLEVSLQREEIEGVLPEREIAFSKATVVEPQTLAPSGAAKAANSFLRLIVPIGEASDPETVETIAEMFNLLAADRWHENADLRKRLGEKRVLLKLSGPVTVRVGDEGANETAERRISLQLELAPSSDPVFVSKP